MFEVLTPALVNFSVLWDATSIRLCVASDVSDGHAFPRVLSSPTLQKVTACALQRSVD